MIFITSHFHHHLVPNPYCHYHNLHHHPNDPYHQSLCIKNHWQLMQHTDLIHTESLKWFLWSDHQKPPPVDFDTSDHIPISSITLTITCSSRCVSRSTYMITPHYLVSGGIIKSQKKKQKSWLFSWTNRACSGCCGCQSRDNSCLFPFSQRSRNKH